jgi:type I restriction enzyme S subunit
MERYKKYKDSGVQWIGNIPSHWESKQLRSFLTLFTEKGHGDAQLLSVTREQGVIERDKDDKEENHNFVPEDLSGYKYIEKGDFAINKMKAWQGSYAVSDYNGIVSPAYYTCKLKGVDKYFFSKAIRSLAYIPFFTQYSKGIRVGQWDLNPNSLKTIPFFLPPIDEQKKIVNYIESKTSKIDEYIAEKEKEVQLLNELKEAEIAKVVTQGLNPNVKMKDSGISWIGLIPEYWNTYILKRLIKERKAGSWGSEPKTSEIDCVCLRIADFDYQNYRFQRKDDLTIRSYKEKDLEDRVLEQGDILIEKSGGGEKSPVGRAVMYDLSIENAMYANFMEKIIPIERLDSSYLTYLLATMYSKRAMWTYIKYTTGIQNLDITSLLSNEKIPLPPLDEQRAIVAYINEKTEKVESLITDLQAEIEHLKEYKQRLIADCVTGQVNVQNE